MKILVVEDEVALRAQLQAFLASKGFAVDVAKTGEEAFYLGTEYAIDAAIIDLGLPDFSGMDLIKRFRKSEKRFPILILTARSRWQEKVEGLEVGADDYMVKPFHYEELWARLNACIRRSAGFSRPILYSGPIEMDTLSQQVRVNGEIMELTAYEYKVLEYLMLHQGEVVSKTTLTEHLYDQDFDRDSNVIEVFVGRLRKKIDPNGQFKPIETLRGRGYRLSV